MAFYSLLDIRKIRVPLFFFLVFLPGALFSQSNVRTTTIDRYRKVLYIGNIPFMSMVEYTYKEMLEYQDEQYCKYVRRVFTINNLPIPEKDYATLSLSKREVDLDNCFFTEYYCGDSISQINLFVQVKIPIVINGVEFLDGDTIPIKEMQGKTLIIKKQKRFLRKNRILIETK